MIKGSEVTKNRQPRQTIRVQRLRYLQALHELERQSGSPVTRDEIMRDILPASLSPSTVDVYLDSWAREDLIIADGGGYRLGIRGQHMIIEARNSRNARHKH